MIEIQPVIKDAKMMKKVRQGLLGLMIVSVGFPVNDGYSVTRTIVSAVALSVIVAP